MEISPFDFCGSSTKHSSHDINKESKKKQVSIRKK